MEKNDSVQNLCLRTYGRKNIFKVILQRGQKNQKIKSESFKSSGDQYTEFMCAHLRALLYRLVLSILTRYRECKWNVICLKMSKNECRAFCQLSEITCVIYVVTVTSKTASSVIITHRQDIQIYYIHTHTNTHRYTHKIKEICFWIQWLLQNVIKIRYGCSPLIVDDSFSLRSDF